MSCRVAAFSAVDASVSRAVLIQAGQRLANVTTISRDIVFIDADLPDIVLLRAGISADAQVYLLDPTKDGVAQIQAAVASHGTGRFDALHIVCHGKPGTVYVGNSVLDNATIRGHAKALAEIGDRLSDNADILLYSCFTGQGTAGTQLVSTLAALTGANVAASESLVGNGEWSLARQSSPISTLSYAWPAWSHTLSNATGTFTSSSQTMTFTNREGDYYVGEYVLGNVEDGTQVKIDHGWISTFFDAYLYVLNRDTGQIVASNDDASGSPNSQVTLAWQSNYVVVPTMYSDTMFASVPVEWQMQARDPETNSAIGSFALLNAAPDITSVNYDASTGELVAGGTNLLAAVGDNNDIIASQLTFTGANGATYTLTDTPNVEITSLSFFRLTLSATDRAAVNALLDQSGTSAIDGTHYSLAAAAGWAAGSPGTSDFTGNIVTASNVATVNQAPVFTSASTITVSENQTSVMTLQATDVDSTTLTFSIHGGEDADLFTLDANTGILDFINAPDFEMPSDADEDRVYQVELFVSDGDEGSALKTLMVTVDDVNEAPTLDVNSGTSMVAGAAVALTSAMLQANDADDPAEGIVYTLTALPAEGVLRLDGNPLLENNTFSQADLNAGKVSFLAGTNRGAQSFTFTLADGGEDGTTPLTDQVFTLNISSPSAPPSSPTSGLIFSSGSQQPNMPSGRPSISEIIRNAGPNQDVVTLVENTGSANIVTASLPVGVTLNHTGSRQAVDQNGAMDDLLASIASKTPGNSTEHNSVAKQWLSSLSGESSIDIRSLSFIAPSAFNGSISLTGSTGSDIGGSASFDAFVIDLSSLPTETQLLLNHIDFASILGAAEITGGLGNNVVIGDNANQTIILGEGDDIIYGGGGDDVIGSLGGDDRLFGGDGNDELSSNTGANVFHGGRDVDMVSYAGNRDAYTVAQTDGVITVSLKDTPSNVDTLINIETLRFADGEDSVNYADNLEWITGLYAQVLGRQGDINGVQYWAQRHAEGMSKADMALLFINSPEAGKQLSSDQRDTGSMVDMLYQSLLGREAEAPGKAYWMIQMENGASLLDVVGGFMVADEMRTHDLLSTQWDFLA